MTDPIDIPALAREAAESIINAGWAGASGGVEARRAESVLARHIAHVITPAFERHEDDERNAGSSIAARMLREIAEGKPHAGVYGGEAMEAAAQAVLSLRAALAEKTQDYTDLHLHAVAIEESWTEDITKRREAEEALEQSQADHHKLGSWPDCPGCVRQAAREMEGAVTNARLEHELAEKTAEVERLLNLGTGSAAKLTAAEQELEHFRGWRDVAKDWERRAFAAEQEVERLRRNRQTADQHDCMLIEEARAYAEEENRRLRAEIELRELLDEPWTSDKHQECHRLGCPRPRDRAAHAPGATGEPEK